MSRRKRRSKGSRKRDTDSLIAHYECLGCGRQWGEDLRALQQMRRSGQIPATYSGTNCTCGHPYIKWRNYDELAPRLRTCTGRTGEEPE